jgi:hypothetical protein
MSKKQDIEEYVPDNVLEERKVRALEKIANSLDALTIWFEEIEKDEWDARLQWYLAEFHNKFVATDEEK